MAIRVSRRLKSVIEVLSDLFILRGVPGYVCSATERSSWRVRFKTGSSQPVAVTKNAFGHMPRSAIAVLSHGSVR